MNDSTALEAGQIESFIYYMTDTGFVPIGGMFVMPSDATNGAEPGGCLTQWHQTWRPYRPVGHGRHVRADAADDARVHLPGLDPWGHYNGRDLVALWTPGSRREQRLSAITRTTFTMGRTKPVGRGAPGRVRTPRAEREQQMIEVASALFAERGFGGVSMEDIATASGITKPMLYAYFDSKEGLFSACAQKAGEHLRDDLRQVSERRDRTPDQRLWDGIQRVFQFVEGNHEGWLLLYPEGGLASGSIGSGAVAARNAMADLLTELFTRTAREKGLSDDAVAHTEAIAHSFTAATIAAASHWAEHEDEPRDVAALRLMNLLWMGCGDLLEGKLWLPDQV